MKTSPAAYPVLRAPLRPPVAGRPFSFDLSAGRIDLTEDGYVIIGRDHQHKRVEVLAQATAKGLRLIGRGELRPEAPLQRAEAAVVSRALDAWLESTGARSTASLATWIKLFELSGQLKAFAENNRS